MRPARVTYSTTRVNPRCIPPSRHFCELSTVRSFFEGKRVALVGSGPGCLDNPRGFVDSHEVVVRVNNYKLTEATGFRTDVFYSFFGSSIKKTQADLIRDGVRLCICKCPQRQFMDSEWHRVNNKMNGVDFRYIYRKRAKFWFCPTYVPRVSEFVEVFEILDRHVPTTGFSALFEVLRHNPASVYMTGFDFFASGIHNVNERWKANNPDDPIGHRPELEKAWVQKHMERITVDQRLKALL